MSICDILRRWFNCPPCPPCPPCPECPPETEYVYVDVCRSSQDIRNTHCPGDNIDYGKKFEKGTEPQKFCDFNTYHKPPPPEPIKEKVGVSFYQLIETEKDEDVVAFIRGVAEHGGNSTEIFLVYEWSNGWKNTPYKIDSYWGEEKFPDEKFPMFDLHIWNNEYWTRLRLIFRECIKNNITLFMRIQDYCSVKYPRSKRRYPYNNGSNLQAYTGGMWGEPIQQWYRLFNKKLVETLEEGWGPKHTDNELHVLVKGNAEELFEEMRGSLNSLEKEMKIMNKHLSLLTGKVIEKEEVE